MKKFLSLFLALAMMLGCLTLLASCKEEKKDDEKEDSLETRDVYGLKDADWEALADKLEDLDYYVSYSKEKETGVLERLYVYGSDDGLEEPQFITIIRLEKSKTAKLSYKTLKAEYDSQIAQLKAEIELYQHLLEDYDEELKNDEKDDYEDELKELKLELKELEEEIVIGFNDTVVWYGTKEILESINNNADSEEKDPHINADW